MIVREAVHHHERRVLPGAINDVKAVVCNTDCRVRGLGHGSSLALLCVVGPVPTPPESSLRRSGSCGSDVDLPSDAELVGESTEDVSPEDLFGWVVLSTVSAQVVIDLAESGFIGSDRRQSDACLWCVRRVGMVARAQVELSGVEIGIDDEALVWSRGIGVYVAASKDGQGAAEDTLVELHCIRSGAGEEEVGVDLHR